MLYILTAFNLLVYFDSWAAERFCGILRQVHCLMPRTLLGAVTALVQLDSVMTSSNGIIFRVTGPLCGEFSVNDDIEMYSSISHRRSNFCSRWIKNGNNFVPSILYLFIRCDCLTAFKFAACWLYQSRLKWPRRIISDLVYAETAGKATDSQIIMRQREGSIHLTISIWWVPLWCSYKYIKMCMIWMIFSWVIFMRYGAYIANSSWNPARKLTAINEIARWWDRNAFTNCRVCFVCQGYIIWKIINSYHHFAEKLQLQGIELLK